MTQPGRAGSTRRRQTHAVAGGLFGGGLLGGLAAGFLGAGLFGMLFGHGFFGGIGGFASFLGLLLQIGIVVFVARLAWAWWQRRNQPAYAGRAGDARAGFRRPAPGMNFGGLGGGLAAAASAAPSDPIEIKPEDFDAFERLLGEVQTAYGNEDLTRCARARRPRCCPTSPRS